MKKIAVIAMLLFVTGLSLWFAVQNVNPRQSYPESDFSIADRMATEGSNLFNHQATIIVLGIKGIREHEDLVRIFSEKLKLVGNFHIVPALMSNAELKLLPDSERTGLTSSENGIDSAVFFNLLKQHPDASAFVSFAGPPDLQDQELQQVRSKKLKMMVFAPNTNSQHLRRLLEANIIQIAVTRRFSDSPSLLTKRPETLN
jgi:hypothetical protein